ncbi:ABC transporter permease [Mycoplasma bradburyae]|uniref:ABC transporter permease n=1 Tax=Mycoplasma bradburyae TaxID=2963128 RepID=A0AAW6HPY5_9MOLU|nr:ABC transporter permease [Mycoplasma bradburyae]MDC4163429.1 ABC transporter permease [Mycoplasma bradburyae]MDC4181686.1 ABC transporter permease [Mycoplasma bradburyae]MDC4182803.1 ABC transporter permease [Mycoplasma bradburyae]MDC4183477.1 ABC transporter permease [Mycoplasma bradburyae]MDC4183861.1 ABC transporter permease [Mycoplasma bradburyae]
MTIQELGAKYQFDKELFERVDVNEQLNKQSQVIGKPSNYIVDIIKRFFKNPAAAVFTVFLIILILLSIIAPIASPYDPINPIGIDDVFFNLPPRIFGLNPTKIARIPSVFLYMYDGVIVDQKDVGNGIVQITYHPYDLEQLRNIYPIFGTTQGGVDVWTNLWKAIQTSLGSALIVSVFATIIGVIYGSISGSFAGKWVDTVMMRIVEIISGLPTIILIIILAQIFVGSDGNVGGNLSLASLNAALISLYWTGPARITRIYIVKTKDAEYIQAARTLGASQWRIIFVHMIPNISGRLSVMFVNFIPVAIFVDSGLVFLGLKSSQDLSLGTILSSTYQNISSDLLHISLPPIIIFSLFTISLQIIANAINDAVDPRIIGRK